LASFESSANLKPRMNAITVLWVYIALLVAGGAAGYLKAKSHVSLYTSLAAAVILALCALHFLPNIVADILMGLLIVVFGIRLARTRKFMPAGLMLGLTILALAARLLLSGTVA
jgi:uncharacterized membrane protein (UPF0136 family)